MVFSGSGRCCAVVECSNSQRKLHIWKQAICTQHGMKHEDCACLIPYSLHRFPRDPTKRKQWVSAINRKDYVPGGSSVVCSIHFVDKRPTSLNPSPQLQLGYPRKVKTSRRILKKNFENYKETSKPELCNSEPQTQEELLEPTHASSGDHNYAALERSKDMSIQTELVLIELTTDSEFMFYTSLSRNMFNKLLEIVIPELPQTTGLSIDQCVLLVLMRLRLGLFIEDLAFRFKTSKATVSRIFNTWVPILARALKDAVLWLPRETIRATMPECFRSHYPHTTCIIDCTEIFVQRPFNYDERAVLYSDYKSHNTVKFLIAIAPNGLIMFVSAGYGGRASDKHITLDSGFLTYLLPNDQVMADRGFTVYEDLLCQKVDLNIPAFTKGKKQLSGIEVVTSRRIASVRIHVERVIGRIKNFKFLKSTLPLPTLKVIDSIIILCAALCNLSAKIV